MRRPRKIRLGYTDLRLRVSRAKALRQSTDPDTECAAIYEASTRSIVLGQKFASGSEGVNSVLHELVHAIADLGHLDLPPKKEEQVAVVISNQLTELIRRNPGLIRWIEQELRAPKK